MDRNMKMSLVRNRHVIVFVFTLLRLCLVFGSSDVGRIKSESSIDSKMIFSHLQLPWMDGVTWLTESNESAQVEKVTAWIRGFEANEKWALQMLNDFTQFKREIRRSDIREIDADDQRNEDNALSNDETQGAQFLDRGIKSGLVTNQLKVGSGTESYMTVAYEDLTRADIFAISLISLVCALMFACTICDFLEKRKPRQVSSTVKTLAKFSLYKNALKLLDMNVTSDTMHAIHGLRLLSCVVIIVGHRYSVVFLLHGQKITTLDLLEWKNSWHGVFLAMSVSAVDTFLVISGFLATHLFFVAKKSGMKFNLFSIYLYRYLRLTPCLGVLILLFTTLFRHTGTGPIAESSFSPVVDLCLKNWWTNLLYIQNIVHNECMCLGQFWYMAVDMQLFWISPLILYPLHRWPKIGLLLLRLLLVGSASTAAFLLAVNGYSNALLRLDFGFSRLSNSTYNFYTATVNHAFPYLLGILLGYEIAWKKRDLTKANVAINWVVAGSLLSLCVWANFKVHHSNFAYDLWIETAVAFLSRPLWSVAIAWIIYACIQGYGGIAAKFLSLPIFVPLSRLSYCLYLVHMLVQGYYIAAAEIATTFSGSVLSHGILGELMTSIAAVSALSLFIESPVLVLVKMLTNDGRRRKEQ